jgi:phage baseplate assembly protein W
MNQRDNNFLGQGWSFPPSFSSRDGQAEMVSHERDVEQSLAILLSTKPGERLLHPTFGCALHHYVFDNLTLTTITAIQDMVERAILHWEPRIDLERVDVEVDDFYEGKIVLNLHYRLRLTNTRTNLVYPFYFREATDVAGTNRS